MRLSTVLVASTAGLAAAAPSPRSTNEVVTVDRLEATTVFLKTGKTAKSYSLTLNANAASNATCAFDGPPEYLPVNATCHLPGGQNTPYTALLTYPGAASQPSFTVGVTHHYDEGYVRYPCNDSRTSANSLLCRKSSYGSSVIPVEQHATGDADNAWVSTQVGGTAELTLV